MIEFKNDKSRFVQFHPGPFFQYWTKSCSLLLSIKGSTIVPSIYCGTYILYEEVNKPPMFGNYHYLLTYLDLFFSLVRDLYYNMRHDI
jgi:hypothetical protein